MKLQKLDKHGVFGRYFRLAWCLMSETPVLGKLHDRDYMALDDLDYMMTKHEAVQESIPSYIMSHLSQNVHCIQLHFGNSTFPALGGQGAPRAP